MLISEPRLLLPETDLQMLAVMEEPGLPSSRQNVELRPGIYLQRGFNAQRFIRVDFNEYPDLKDFDIWSSYGVCDDVKNLLAFAPWLEESNRRFLVLLSEVRRDQSNAGNGGGWRWDKWGPYIGAQDPTCEYLDDEPLIECIYCFQIFESVATRGA